MSVCEMPLPPLQGRPGLCQGVYGDRGNLELVVPDVDDGFWVFWFNNDADDHGAPGALPGNWSGGLHVRSGERVDAIAITQVPWGPNHLEAITLAAGHVHRWMWTPEHGFVDAGELMSDVVDVGPLEVADGLVSILVVRSDRRQAMLTADANDYPYLRWQPKPADDAVMRDGTSAQVTVDGTRTYQTVHWEAGRLMHRIATVGKGEMTDDGEREGALETPIVSRVRPAQGQPVHREAPAAPRLTEI